jgi:formylglycine-generating enzyme required for sulfatase activity
VHFPTASSFLYISNKGDTTLPLFELTLMGEDKYISLDYLYNQSHGYLFEKHQGWGLLWTERARWRVHHQLCGISHTHLNLWCVNYQRLVQNGASQREKEALSLMMSVGSKELIIYMIPQDPNLNFTVEQSHKYLKKVLNDFDGLSYTIILPYFSIKTLLEQLDQSIELCQQQPHSLSTLPLKWPRNYLDALVPIPSGQYTGIENQTWHVDRPFFMSQTLVTQALFYAVTHQSMPDRTSMNLPLQRCSWIEAVFFCNLLSKKMNLPLYYKINWRDSEPAYEDFSSFSEYSEKLRLTLEHQSLNIEIINVAGIGFRLPTFDEWCYAAAACQTHAYAGGDYVSEVAWSSHNSGSKTHPIATLTPNRWGLYDMSGNLWEWCQNGPKDNDYSILCASPHHSKWLLGGSWANHPWIFSLGEGLSELPIYQDDFSGFRVVRNHAQEEVKALNQSDDKE